ncbi:CBO0543 family protein [Neobacillus jeddahensis]|uniref:CBO0543 family protein n=1 Tax=Neobacillus jeddahensis TaxID=1461580 RepID=UPI0005913527|nr:CBO0543 family protein [Neobacillus jeddahensis]
MNLERWILIGITLLCILGIWKLVPRERTREAWVLFLSMQIITWPSGLIVVENNWIEYPVQLLPKSNYYNKASFIFEFFLLPVISIIFSLHHPNTNKKGTLSYYLCISSFLTGCEVILERTTDLVEYHQWKWYWTLITLIASLYVNDKYYRWFTKKMGKVEENE